MGKEQLGNSGDAQTSCFADVREESEERRVKWFERAGLLMFIEWLTCYWLLLQGLNRIASIYLPARIPRHQKGYTFLFSYPGGPLPLCAFAWKPWHLSKISGGMRWFQCFSASVELSPNLPLIVYSNTPTMYASARSCTWKELQQAQENGKRFLDSINNKVQRHQMLWFLLSYHVVMSWMILEDTLDSLRSGILTVIYIQVFISLYCFL